MQYVSCTYDRHASQILDIFNDAIINSTALYDYVPRPPESMVGWFKVKEAGQFPVIGMEDSSGKLVGFASYGTFRGWPAYKYTIENGIYVHKDCRGQGIGLDLMQQLIRAAADQQYHVMVAGIDAENAASIALHKKLGFVEAGIIRHAGFKFGHWLDLAFYQLTLDTPAHPVDG